MVEQLRLEVGARPAEDFYVFEHTYKPAPEPPGSSGDGDESEKRDPRPALDDTGASGGLEGIRPTATAAFLRRRTWRCIRRVSARRGRRRW
jgi:hypothetical protein